MKCIDISYLQGLLMTDGEKCLDRLWNLFLTFRNGPSRKITAGFCLCFQLYTSLRPHSDIPFLVPPPPYRLPWSQCPNHFWIHIFSKRLLGITKLWALSWLPFSSPLCLWAFLPGAVCPCGGDLPKNPWIPRPDLRLSSSSSFFFPNLGNWPFNLRLLLSMSEDFSWETRARGRSKC